MLYTMVHNLHQLLGNGHSRYMHTHAMCLHHSRLTIAIDHQSRQVVTLTVHQSIGIVGGIVSDADTLPHLEGRQQTVMPETIIDLYVTKREHSHRNRSYLKMPHGNKGIVGRYHLYYFSFCNARISMMDGPREHPRVESLQTLLLTFLEIYFLVCHNSRFSVHNPSSPTAAATPYITVCKPRHR